MPIIVGRSLPKLRQGTLHYPVVPSSFARGPTVLYAS
jgi:hypothetical protein